MRREVLESIMRGDLPEEPEGIGWEDDEYSDIDDVGTAIGWVPLQFLDTTAPEWKRRRRRWRDMFDGLDGRRDYTYGRVSEAPVPGNPMMGIHRGVSRYDEYLCELLYRWFNRSDSSVLDPFAGGPARGVIAASLGFDYVGYDVRKEQVQADRAAVEALGLDGRAKYECGSLDTLSTLRYFGHCQTSPPFPFVEHYSDQPNDLSAAPNIEAFQAAYEPIFRAVYHALFPASLCVVDIGDGRDRQGAYYGFTEWQVGMMRALGFRLINRLYYLRHYRSRLGLIRACRFARSTRRTRALIPCIGQVYVYERP